MIYYFAVRVPKTKWPNIYWFQHEQNHLYHPQCADRQFLKKRDFCGDPKYLDGICTGRYEIISKFGGLLHGENHRQGSIVFINEIFQKLRQKTTKT